MIGLSLPQRSSGGLQILCLGAHSDDIEIGCGGTILRLAQEHPNCSICWVVFSAIGVRNAEARRAAELFGGAAVHGLFLKEFKDGFMPYMGGEVKAYFEELKASVAPDLILTHYGGDAHQDHRLINELTWNTFRNHLILEYEIPKYDGDIGQPNVFVPLSAEISRQKIRYLTDAFASQQSKPWFQEATFLSLLRLRGMECNSPSTYAEAFHCRKLVV